MSRVLHDVRVSGHARVVGDPTGPAVVGDLKDLFDDAVAAAFERGRQEGYAAGRAEAIGSVEQVAASLRDAAAEGLDFLRAHRKEEAAEAMKMAVDIAAHVMGREPAGDGALLVDRIRAALEELEDVPLRVFVNPADHELVAAALAKVDGVEVVADATASPGEGRITGPWSNVAITRAAAVEAVCRAVGLEP